jgi:hypothetical protein
MVDEKDRDCTVCRNGFAHDVGGMTDDRHLKGGGILISAGRQCGWLLFLKDACDANFLNLKKSISRNPVSEE